MKMKNTMFRGPIAAALLTGLLCCLPAGKLQAQFLLIGGTSTTSSSAPRVSQVAVPDFNKPTFPPLGIYRPPEFFSERNRSVSSHFALHSDSQDVLVRYLAI